MGQKLARLTYSFLHVSEYVQVADLEADSVGGPKEISKPNSPGYSVVLGIVGKWEGYGTGEEASGVEASLYELFC